ncbi:type I-F CRISPR-associated protein Csy1 [Rheinheimera sp. UJ63]|uniref:type I-F CRISPR-associated protein Csy1 n=1 Tax=Rheinheimera sp. UJ63 TaxID=2910157 RepID=UPI001F470773|nr:type I-F CRISPR-associated protein Csy1 [Rheinheimera sp. UJ63]MCF4010651.1 type I-F CRISPR-associated protein Csy1 [Rheinheimera sp. UJ63]
MSGNSLSNKISEFINAIKADKIEKAKKALNKEIKKAKSDTEREELTARHEDLCSIIEKQYCISDFLDLTSKRAKQLTHVTHPAKFSHSKNGASGIFAIKDTNCTPYLTTSCLTNTYSEFSGNAAASNAAQLLTLNHNGQSLLDAIKNGDYSALEPFAKDKTQLDAWVNDLMQVLTFAEPKSHRYAKQVYFPVTDGQYHLISPMYSSSLSQALYERVVAIQFGSEEKAVRDAKKANRYHEKDVVVIPNTAVQIFGGNNKQNISFLNAKRLGKGFLLNSAPPSWASSLKPPIYAKSIFEVTEFTSAVWPLLKDLQNYIELIQKRDSTIEMRKNLVALVNGIIDELLNYAAKIQGLKKEAGWSQAGCSLPNAEKLWLDPLCNDLEFQRARSNMSWQKQVCEHFADWLNNRMNYAFKGKGIVFGKPQHAYWEKIFASRLRDYELGTEVTEVYDNVKEDVV